MNSKNNRKKARTAIDGSTTPNSSIEVHQAPVEMSEGIPGKLQAVHNTIKEHSALLDEIAHLLGQIIRKGSPSFQKEEITLMVTSILKEVRYLLDCKGEGSFENYNKGLSRRIRELRREAESLRADFPRKSSEKEAQAKATKALGDGFLAVYRAASQKVFDANEEEVGPEAELQKLKAFCRK